MSRYSRRVAYYAYCKIHKTWNFKSNSTRSDRAIEIEHNDNPFIRNIPVEYENTTWDELYNPYEPETWEYVLHMWSGKDYKENYVPKRLRTKEKVDMEELNGLIKTLTEKLADAEKVVKPKTGKILLLASAAFAAYKLLQSKSSTKTKSK